LRLRWRIYQVLKGASILIMSAFGDRLERAKLGLILSFHFPDWVYLNNRLLKDLPCVLKVPSQRKERTDVDVSGIKVPLLQSTMYLHCKEAYHHHHHQQERNRDLSQQTIYR